MRGDALLDLILTNKKEFIGDVKAEVSPGCSDCEVTVWEPERRIIKQTAVLTSWDFRTADFGLFRSMFRRLQWDTILERRVVQERQWIFKD